MAVPLRQLSTAELLSSTVSLYVEHAGLFVGIAALASLGNLAMSLFIPQAASLVPRSSGGCLSAIAMLLLPLLGAVVGLAVAALTQGATLAAIAEMMLGGRATVAGSFARTRNRIVELMVVMFVLGIGTAIGFVLLIVPGVILLLMWAVALPAAVFEGMLFSEAASRSSELTSGHRGRIALLVVAGSVVYLLVSFIAHMVVLAVWGADPVPQGIPDALTARHVASAVSNYLVGSVVGPLATIGTSLLYFDLRVRKEEYTVERLAADWTSDLDTASS